MMDVKHLNVWREIVKFCGFGQLWKWVLSQSWEESKHFKGPCGKTGIQTSFLSLSCRHIECERNLMAQRLAPLNMNKPSSAENQAKPNSARRHHSSTGQEALEPLLASTDELHHPPPSPQTPVPKVNCPSKKDNGLKKHIILQWFFLCCLIFNYC